MPPPPTMATDGQARDQMRLFQRLDVPPRNPLHQEHVRHQPGTPLSKQAIGHFYRAARAYRKASQRALDELTASTAPVEQAADDVWSLHCLMVESLVECTPYLADCLDTTTSAAFFTLLYGVTRYQKALLLVKEGHRIVEKLNNHEQIQKLRGEVETADQMRRIVAFRKRRQAVFEDRLAQARRAVSWFDAQRPEDPDAHAEWEDWAWHHSEQWWRAQWVMDEEMKELRQKVKPWLHAHLEPEHPDMATGTSLMRTVDELIDKMYAEAFPSADEEEEEEDDDDSARDVSVWTRQKLAELKASLEHTFIIINTESRQTSPDLALLEMQLLDNTCPISMVPFETPCELAGCHHVFSFEHVVLWLDAFDRPKCPKCRGVTSFDDLRLLDVVGMEVETSSEDEREDSDGIDDSIANGDHEAQEESLDDVNLSIAIQFQVEDEGEQEEDCLPAGWI